MGAPLDAVPEVRWFRPVRVDFDDLRSVIRRQLVGAPGEPEEVPIWATEVEDSLGPVDYSDAHVWTVERYMFDVGPDEVSAAVGELLGHPGVQVVECLVPATDTYDPLDPRALVFLAPTVVGSPAEVLEVVRAGRAAGPLLGRWISEHPDLLLFVLAEGTKGEVVDLIDLHDALYLDLRPDVVAFALRDRPEMWPAARAAMARAVDDRLRAAARHAGHGFDLFADAARGRAAEWAAAKRALNDDPTP